RIGIGADRAGPCLCLLALQQDMPVRRDCGMPAGLDDDGLVFLDDERRALDAVAGPKVPTQVHLRLAPASAHEDARALGRFGLARLGDRLPFLLCRLAPVRALEGDGLDNQRLVLVDEAELDRKSTRLNSSHVK